MDITILFEKVLGIYLVLSGILVLIKQENMVSISKMFGRDMALRYSVGFLITLGGLFMVLSYRDWSSVQSSLVTLVGWLVLIKGVVLLFASDSQIGRMTGSFMGGNGYRIWGVVALIAGGYLVLSGFGFLV